MKRLLLTIARFFLGERAFNPEFDEAVRRCSIKLRAFLATPPGKMYLSITQSQRRHVMIHNPRRPFAGHLIISAENDQLCVSVMVRHEMRNASTGIPLGSEHSWHNYPVPPEEIATMYLNQGQKEEDFITFLTAGVVVA
jgi:hypothetical protein